MTPADFRRGDHLYLPHTPSSRVQVTNMYEDGIDLATLAGVHIIRWTATTIDTAFGANNGYPWVREAQYPDSVRVPEGL